MVHIRRLCVAASVAVVTMAPDARATPPVDRSGSDPSPARWSEFFTEFATNAQMHTHLDSLADHPAATLLSYGTSFEGRPLEGLLVGDGTQPTVVAVGTQHAREWISPMVVACLAEAFALQEDPTVVDVSEKLDFLFLPIANPDGYAYSHEVDRYWRKNRRDGHGVDLNRNWDVSWGVGTSGAGTSSEAYPGSEPFSEPETAAIRDLLVNRPVVAFLDYHSPIALVLYPYAFTSAPSEEEEREWEWGNAMAQAITAVHGVEHGVTKPGSGNPSGGLAQDWALAELGALSWTVELRGGSGGGGFEIPASEISPACDENLAGFLEIAVRAADEFGEEPGTSGDGGEGEGGTDDGESGTGSTTTGDEEETGTSSGSTDGGSEAGADTDGVDDASGTESDVPSATGDAGGCSCHVRSRSGRSGPGGLALLMLAAVARRRSVDRSGAQRL